jgi:hypothetical protein
MGRHIITVGRRDAARKGWETRRANERDRARRVGARACSRPIRITR